MKHEREELAAKRGDAKLFLLAYEKFQWKNNLTSMRTFIKEFTCWLLEILEFVNLQIWIIVTLLL